MTTASPASTSRMKSRDLAAPFPQGRPERPFPATSDQHAAAALPDLHCRDPENVDGDVEGRSHSGWRRRRWQLAGGQSPTGNHDNVDRKDLSEINYHIWINRATYKPTPKICIQNQGKHARPLYKSRLIFLILMTESVLFCVAEFCLINFIKMRSLY